MRQFCGIFMTKLKEYERRHPILIIIWSVLITALLVAGVMVGVSFRHNTAKEDEYIVFNNKYIGPKSSNRKALPASTTMVVPSSKIRTGLKRVRNFILWKLWQKNSFSFQNPGEGRSAGAPVFLFLQIQL